MIAAVWVMWWYHLKNGIIMFFISKHLINNNNSTNSSIWVKKLYNILVTYYIQPQNKNNQVDLCRKHFDTITTPLRRPPNATRPTWTPQRANRRRACRRHGDAYPWWRLALVTPAMPSWSRGDVGSCRVRLLALSRNSPSDTDNTDYI